MNKQKNFSLKHRRPVNDFRHFIESGYTGLKNPTYGIKGELAKRAYKHSYAFSTTEEKSKEIPLKISLLLFLSPIVIFLFFFLF